MDVRQADVSPAATRIIRAIETDVNITKLLPMDNDRENANDLVELITVSDAVGQAMQAAGAPGNHPCTQDWSLPWGPGLPVS